MAHDGVHSRRQIAQVQILGCGLEIAGLRRGQKTAQAPARCNAVELISNLIEYGFYGICGLDAFAFRSSGGAEVLRPVVEFNARFTVGTISIGLVERALRCGVVRPPTQFRFGGERGLEVSEL